MRESIRQGIHKLPREQQESYIKSVADTYRALADLLLKQDRVLEAQQVLDLLKVQELEDYLHTVRSANPQANQKVSFNALEQPVIKNLDEFNQRAIDLGTELTKLEDKKTALRQTSSGSSLSASRNRRLPNSL